MQALCWTTSRLPLSLSACRTATPLSGCTTTSRTRQTLHSPAQEPGSAYLADEVMFMLPAARAAEETQESIAADFSGWWKYGEAWDGQEKAPTVEERLAVMEDFMVAIMEG